ncbi:MULTISPECIES: DUF3572 domain-containing protein [Pacificibacter]|uniref:DUF3572 domain-containing protein n=1 Tax=Pacificibacter TaxID=1042323 RepID=UPI001C0A13EA|nr:MULTISPECIES: DUF3572 domain-containing protein [Pacificibacter]MBU2937434.1 DUF3572 domain-containing protein [Pacificibacter marinus]MDO6615613.1 DUF3572 domain-containing protein [Pacificibacter sp. 1_MG-2023]
MQQNSAEILALKILVWLVGNEELLPVFLGSTGLGEDDLRNRASEPELLAAVLEFVMMNDEWVNDFAQNASIDPYDVVRARQALPGGEDIHWT